MKDRQTIEAHGWTAGGGQPEIATAIAALPEAGDPRAWRSVLEVVAAMSWSRALRKAPRSVRRKVLGYLCFCAMARSTNPVLAWLDVLADLLSGPQNPVRTGLFDVGAMRQLLGMPSADSRAALDAWIAAGLPGSPIPGLDLVLADIASEDVFDRLVAGHASSVLFSTDSGEHLTMRACARALSNPAFAIYRQYHAWEGPDAARAALAGLAGTSKKTHRFAATYWELMPAEPAETVWPMARAMLAARAEIPGLDVGPAIDYRRFVPFDTPEQAVAVARRAAHLKRDGVTLDVSLLVSCRDAVPAMAPEAALDLVAEISRLAAEGVRVATPELLQLLRGVPTVPGWDVIDLINRAGRPENTGMPLFALRSHPGHTLAAMRRARDTRAAFRTSERFATQFAGAAALDPSIALPDGTGYMPPWHDVDYFGYAAARALLPEGPVDHVVLVPFGKLGGADYVAGILAATLAERGRTVILRTDLSDWDRPDWYPDTVPAIDLSGALSGMGDPARALFTLLRVLSPEAVWNVNSRLGFDTFATYGQRLSDSHRLYAYYFCADRTPQGQETGYPVWYMADILPHLQAALVDTRSLADTLATRYAMPPVLAGKLHTLHTPAQRPADSPPLVAAQIDSAAGRDRSRILWAGRLDRQKRFDILEAVARAMPDVDFIAWGKTVLGKPPSARKLPANLVLNPPFRGYDELPLADCDGWLYTAAWDGLPTILIECGAMGIPIVASAVGGVPELIDDTTGWPVRDADDTAAYVTALREMLADPEDRRRRATALQTRVRTRHSPDAFRNAIDSIG